MTRPGLRLLAITVLALAIGFFAGVRAAASMAPSHHRWMAPPVPANLALYEPPTTSSGASTPVSALTTGIVPAESMPPNDRPAAGQVLRGYATWFATGPDCLCAAAGADLRRAIGTDWRGTMVEVRVPMANRRLIEVKLADWCLCGPRDGQSTVIDLSLEAIYALNLEPRKGVYQVTVTWP